MIIPKQQCKMVQSEQQCYLKMTQYELQRCERQSAVICRAARQNTVSSTSVKVTQFSWVNRILPGHRSSFYCTRTHNYPQLACKSSLLFQNQRRILQNYLCIGFSLQMNLSCTTNYRIDHIRLLHEQNSICAVVCRVIMGFQ